ncbi:MAG: cell division protein CrgA [Candidatus Nanopelagicales bacterium]
MPVSKTRKKKQSHTHTTASGQQEPVYIGPNPWVAPLMVGTLVFGLLWIVVFYLAGDRIGFMQSIGNLGNVLIGFGFIGVGFALSTKWR